MPSSYFYSEDDLDPSDPDYDRALGSLIDEYNIYYRSLSNDEKFTLEGNYFKLDATNFPTIVRSWRQITAIDKIVSHTSLFYFYSKTGNQAAIQNIKLDGNAPRSELVSLGGGIIMAKTEGVNFNITNAITIRWYISYFADYAHYVNAAAYDSSLEPTYHVNYCRSYDNFTGFVYNWGSKMEIHNSDFVQSGGPAILQDFVPKEKDVVNEVVHVPSTVVTNTNIENYVAGNEGWFNMHGANAVVPSIKALDGFLNLVNRSFLKKGASGELYFNMISLNKDGGSEGPTSNPNTIGSFKMDDFAFDYGQTDPLFGGFYNNVKTTGAPIFYTNTGGMAFTDASTGLYTGINPSNGQPISATTSDAIASGDKVALYYNGMQIVFGYNSL